MIDKRIETCTLDLYLVGGGGFRRLNPFNKRIWQWQAHAISPNETYIAAWSDTFEARGTTEFLTSDIEASNHARNEVLSIMLSEGWISSDNRHQEQVFTRPFEG